MADNSLSDFELRCSLRSLARKGRDALAGSERGRASAQITRSVCALTEIVQAKSILLYSAFRSEVDTDELCKALLHDGKTVCVPLAKPVEKDIVPIVVDKEDFPLQPGYHGIPEPKWCAGKVFTAQNLDIVVVPGLLFDSRGNRLGYGGGFYDRFLANKAPQALRVGLAYSCQLADSIPAHRHDMRMDILVTELDVLRWPRR